MDRIIAFLIGIILIAVGSYVFCLANGFLNLKNRLWVIDRAIEGVFLAVFIVIAGFIALSYALYIGDPSSILQKISPLIEKYH